MAKAHKAPREDVVRVYRTGGRGNTVWVHELSCGHFENRARKSKSHKIGCTQCLAEWGYRAEWLAVDAQDHEIHATYLMDLELSGISFLSTLIGVSPEMIQAVYGQRGSAEFLSGFMVWVPLDAIKRDE